MSYGGHSAETTESGRLFHDTTKSNAHTTDGMRMFGPFWARAIIAKAHLRFASLADKH